MLSPGNEKMEKDDSEDSDSPSSPNTPRPAKGRAARDLPYALPTGSEPIHPISRSKSVLATQQEEEIASEELLLLREKRQLRADTLADFQQFRNEAEHRGGAREEIEASVVNVLRGTPSSMTHRAIGVQD